MVVTSAQLHVAACALFNARISQMKVLKPGRPQFGWAKEFTCTGAGNRGGGCGALLLVERADLFQTMHCARDETDYFATFRCGACGVLTDLPDGVSPVRADQLPKRR